MRLGFLELLRPLCPRCGKGGAWSVENPAPLLRHGRLVCHHPGCGSVYPVVDGVPVLTAKPEDNLAANAAVWLRRDDLPAALDEAFNAATGPGSWSDTPRQQVSTYAWDHYGDLDPEAHDEDFPPGSVTRLLDEALALLDDAPSGPVLDAGCGLGRTTVHLATRTGQPALGVDLNAAFLRVFQRVLTEGRIRYFLRRNGVSYLEREHEVILPFMDQADAWMCDASALPFARATFGLVSAFHLLDSAADPLLTLRELVRVLKPGGTLLLSCPYDWSAGVTPPAAWWGGTPASPDPAAGLRQALAEQGLLIIGERAEVPWTLRLHDRAGMHYRAHVLAARKA